MEDGKETNPEPPFIQFSESYLDRLINILDASEEDRFKLAMSLVDVHVAFHRSKLPKYENTARYKQDEARLQQYDDAIGFAQALQLLLWDLNSYEYAVVSSHLETSETIEKIGLCLDELMGGYKELSEDVAMRLQVSQQVNRLPRGRKRNDDLRAYVFGLALIFERFSRRSFTFFRHKDNGGNYIPVTEGHRFVVHAAHDWIGTLINPNSLAVECERVVSLLRATSRKKPTPKKDYF